jgi:hypothetical protein
MHLPPSLLVYTASSQPHPAGAKKRNTSFSWLFWTILVGWSVRLIVVAFVYKGFLDPNRDHWELGYEIGRVASAGFQQVPRGIKQYGTGPDGFAKRFGASYGTGSMDTILGSAVLPSLFKQDPNTFTRQRVPSSTGRCMPSACQLSVKVITDTGNTTTPVCSVVWQRAVSRISTSLRLTGMVSD